MGSSPSDNFDTDFFNKYATLPYYISKGSSGIVYGPIQLNDKHLAIKQVLFANNECIMKKDLATKQKMWTSFKHEHLTKIYSVDLSQLPKVMYIVMEFAGGDSLNKTLRTLGSENHLPIDAVTDWVKQIAEGMLYLHKENIVHRDLKSSNILLLEPFDVNNPHKRITLKITDFDEVREFDHTTTMSFVGTCAYMAPEVLLNETFTKASDVWSFGVLIWEMLTKDIPHKGLQPSEIIAKSLRGELNGLVIAPSFPEYYKFILENCWKSTYEERFSFQQILDGLDPGSITSQEESEEQLRPLPGIIELTNEPDMITLEDDPNTIRAKMPCGHVIGPAAMACYIKDVVRIGKFKFVCPDYNCNCEWPYFLVRHVACLSDADTRLFEKKLADNFLQKKYGFQKCPGCQTWCLRPKRVGNCVCCPFCTIDKGRKFAFCWVCLGEWKRFRTSGSCGNRSCARKGNRINILANCPTTHINLSFECPVIRACPNCHLLIQFKDKCGHITCLGCGCRFCFVCLKQYINYRWHCSFLSTCQVAPRQGFAA